MMIHISVGERSGFLAGIPLARLVQFASKVANVFFLQRIALY